MKYIAWSESPEKIEQLSKDADFEEVSVDTVRLINACTNSKIEVAEGEEIVNMCKGFDGYGQKRYEKGRAEGSWLKLKEQVTKKLVKGKSIETIAEELEETLEVIERICESAITQSE